MRLDEYAAHDGTGLSALLARKEITPKELGQCIRDAVSVVNPALNAVVELYADALEALPENSGPGPFFGVPTLTKDFPVEAGRPAEFGSRLAQGHRAQVDAVYWQRLRNGGLVNVGRTTSSEFGVPAATETLFYGPTRNPWDTNCGVAGSSGGAAAAVAAGIVPFAQGSDGGGSIRNPASFCGLIGLKPSRGRITGSPGANARLLGLATAFMLTRSVRDTAALLDLCHGPDAGDGYEITSPKGTYLQAIEHRPKGLRIALCTKSWSGIPLDPEVVQVTEAAAREMESYGYLVEEVSPHFDYAGFLHAQKVIWAADAAAGMPAIAQLMGREINEHTLGSSVYALYRYGLAVSGAELINALAVYDVITRQLGRFLADYEVMLTPTATIPPEPIGTFDPDRAGMDADGVFADLAPKETFTALFNGTGHPAISLPLGRSSQQLPIGVQLVAPFGREDILLSLAQQFEDARTAGTGIWGQGIPPVHAGHIRER
ncbi:amidase [Ochrobactrum sp. CM-21-5]|nr:amidase [Ochrobactrum sp. CM-21-5]MBC2887165.1 amidase [Ochrobactrum sp. CM-21-5]